MLVVFDLVEGVHLFDDLREMLSTEHEKSSLRLGTFEFKSSPVAEAHKKDWLGLGVEGLPVFFPDFG